MKIEKALGLVQPRRGHPGKDLDEQVSMAATIWRLRMAGDSHAESIYAVHRGFRCSERTAASAWSKHRLQGFVRFRLSRIVRDAPPWTEEEIRLACKVGGRVLGECLWHDWLESGKPGRRVNALARTMG
jgi:hypothetical protein